MHLRTLQKERTKTVADLKQQCFGGSLSGLPFTSLHDDLITEIFNGKTKPQVGPHAAGFNTKSHQKNPRSYMTNF